MRCRIAACVPVLCLAGCTDRPPGPPGLGIASTTGPPAKLSTDHIPYVAGRVVTVGVAAGAEIEAAKLHYHEHTDEVYYIIAGSGRMVLDDDEIEVHPGVVVYVPRGTRHKAVGRLTVLTVCIPRGVLDDVHELE